MGYIFGGNSGITAEELQRKRDIVRAIQQKNSIARNVPEGINDLADGVISAILQGQDRAGQKAFDAKFSPVASALLGGGTKPVQSKTPVAEALTKPGTGQKAEIVDYIKTAASKRGISPDVAVRVAASEGLNADPNEAWQSNFVKNGKRERSYGPFQLYVDGGLGNEFMKTTGLDPRDGSTWKQQVDFALDQAAKGGWGPWYGAKRIGLDNWAGINRGGGTQAVAQALNIQPASAPPPGMMENGQPAPMGTAMTGFPPQQPPMAPPNVQPASATPPAAPAPAPMTAYQRMMQQGIAKGEAGGLQGPVGRQQMASVMGQGGGVSPGILSALGLGGGSPAPPPMAAAPNPNDPAVQQSMGKVAADTNAMSQPQIQQGDAEAELAQVPTEQLIALFNDPRANPQQREFLKMMIEKRMQQQDPAYQLDLQTKQLQLQKLQQELNASGVETVVVGDALVNKQTGEVIYKATKEAEPPKSRDRIEGNEKVFEEWDGSKFKEVSRGPAYKTTPDTVVNNNSGVKEEKIFDEAKDQKAAAQSAAVGLASLSEAEKALPGAITGAGADQVLQLQKLGQLFGVGDTRAIVDTETFRSAIAPQVAAMLKATVGTAQISNADREFAEKAAGGSIALDKQSIARLIRIMKAANSEVIRGYNARMDQVYPADTMSRERALLGVPNVPKVYANPIGPGSPLTPEQQSAAPTTLGASETAPQKTDREQPKLAPGTAIGGLDALPEGHQATDDKTGTMYWRRGGKIFVKKKGEDWGPMK